MSGGHETWTSRELPLLRMAPCEVDAGRSPEFEQLSAEIAIISGTGLSTPSF
jgi:hypothetical protein